MIVHFAMALLVYAAAAVQAALGSKVVVAGGRPEFLLLAAVVAIVFIRGWPALVWAAAIGLVGDCLSDRPPGAGMLAATVVLLFVQRKLHERPAGSPLQVALISTVGIALIVLCRETIAAVAAGQTRDVPTLLIESASTGACSGLLTLAVYVTWQLTIGRFLRAASNAR